MPTTGLRQSKLPRNFDSFFNLFQRGGCVSLGAMLTGTEEEVVRLTPQTVEIKLGFLTRYLRAKQMHLAVQFDGNSASTLSLAELGLQPGAGGEKETKIGISNTPGVNRKVLSPSFTFSP